MRIGQGFDVHQLVLGDGLPLGGVWIDCELAVVAHSDGDVLLHAIMDALLGAWRWAILAIIFRIPTQLTPVPTVHS